MVSNFPNLPDDMFLVCQRSLENVVKLIVRDSTGQDNSLASITWHCVQYSEAVSVNSKTNMLIKVVSSLRLVQTSLVNV